MEEISPAISTDLSSSPAAQKTTSYLWFLPTSRSSPGKRIKTSRVSAEEIVSTTTVNDYVEELKAKLQFFEENEKKLLSSHENLVSQLQLNIQEYKNKEYRNQKEISQLQSNQITNEEKICEKDAEINSIRIDFENIRLYCQNLEQQVQYVQYQYAELERVFNECLIEKNRSISLNVELENRCSSQQLNILNLTSALEASKSDDSKIRIEQLKEDVNRLQLLINSSDVELQKQRECNTDLSTRLDVLKDTNGILLQENSKLQSENAILLQGKLSGQSKEQEFIDRYEQQIQKLQSEISTLQSQIQLDVQTKETMYAEYMWMQSEYTTMSSNYSRINSEYEQVKGLYDQLQIDFGSINTEVASLRKEVSAKASIINEQQLSTMNGINAVPANNAFQLGLNSNNSSSPFYGTEQQSQQNNWQSVQSVEPLQSLVPKQNIGNDTVTTSTQTEEDYGTQSQEAVFNNFVPHQESFQFGEVPQQSNEYFEKYEEVQQQFDELQRSWNDLQYRLESTTSQLQFEIEKSREMSIALEKNRSSLAECETQLQQVNQNNMKLSTENYSLTANIDKHKNDAKQLQNVVGIKDEELQALQYEFENIRFQLQSEREQYQYTQQQQARMESEYYTMNNALETALSEVSVCKETEKKINESLNELRSIVIGLQSDNLRLSMANSSALSDKQAFDTTIDELKCSIKVLEEKNLATSVEKNELVQSQQRLKDQLSQQQEAYQTCEAELNRKLEECNSLRYEMQSVIDTYNYQQQEFGNYQQQFVYMQQEYSNMESNMSAVNLNLEQALGREQSLSKELQQVRTEALQAQTEMESRRTREVGDMNKRIADLESKLSGRETEINRLTSLCSELEIEQGTADQRVSDLNDHIDKYSNDIEQLNASLSNQQSENDQLKESIKAMQQSSMGLEKDLKEEKYKLATLMQEKETLMQNHRLLESEAASLKEKIASKDEYISRYDEELKRKAEEYSSLQYEAQTVMNNFQYIQQELYNIQQQYMMLESEYSNSVSTVAELNSKIELFNENEQSLNNELSRLKAAMREVSTLKEEIAKAQADNDKLNSDMVSLLSETTNLRMSKQSLTEQLDSLRSENSICKDELQKTVQSNAALQSCISTLNDTVLSKDEILIQKDNEIRQKIDEFNYLQYEAQSYMNNFQYQQQQQLETLQQKLLSVESEYAEAGGKIRELNQSLEEKDFLITNLKDQASQLTTELDSVKRSLDNLNYDRSSTNENMATLQNQLRDVLLSKALLEDNVNIMSTEQSKSQTLISSLHREISANKSFIQEKLERMRYLENDVQKKVEVNNSLQLELMRVTQIAESSQQEIVQFNSKYDKLKADFDSAATNASLLTSDLKHSRNREELLSRELQDVISANVEKVNELNNLRYSNDALRMENQTLRELNSKLEVNASTDKSRYETLLQSHSDITNQLADALNGQQLSSTANAILQKEIVELRQLVAVREAIIREKDTLIQNRGDECRKVQNELECSNQLFEEHKFNYNSMENQFFALQSTCHSLSEEIRSLNYVIQQSAIEKTNLYSEKEVLQSQIVVVTEDLARLHEVKSGLDGELSKVKFDLGNANEKFTSLQKEWKDMKRHADELQIENSQLIRSKNESAAVLQEVQAQLSMKKDDLVNSEQERNNLTNQFNSLQCEVQNSMNNVMVLQQQYGELQQYCGQLEEQLMTSRQLAEDQKQLFAEASYRENVANQDRQQLRSGLNQLESNNMVLKSENNHLLEKNNNLLEANKALQDEILQLKASQVPSQTEELNCLRDLVAVREAIIRQKDQDIQDHVDKFIKLHHELDRSTQLIEDQQQLSKSLEQKCSQMESDNSSLSIEIHNLNVELRQSLISNGTLQNEIDYLKSSSNSHTEDVEKYKMNEQRLIGESNQFQANMKIVSDKLLSLQLEYDILQKQKEELQTEKSQQIQLANDSKKDFQNQLAAKNSSIENLERELNSLSQERDTLQAEAQIAVSSLLQLQQQHGELEQHCIQLEKKLRASNFGSSDLELGAEDIVVIVDNDVAFMQQKQNTSSDGLQSEATNTAMDCEKVQINTMNDNQLNDVLFEEVLSEDIIEQKQEKVDVEFQVLRSESLKNGLHETLSQTREEQQQDWLRQYEIDLTVTKDNSQQPPQSQEKRSSSMDKLQLDSSSLSESLTDDRNNHIKEYDEEIEGEEAEVATLKVTLDLEGDDDGRTDLQ
mmetsp:Transcript_34217/g.46992  ORF Transcript_34217/g.46992 Transcript_34217/m.46992 type:complete len:2195 (+) Transcript_34217:79-6663(+)